MACLTNPGKAQSWMAEGRAIAGRLGISLTGVTSRITEMVRTTTGADPFGKGMWQTLGVDPDTPMCLMNNATGTILSFQVKDEKVLKNVTAKFLAPADGTPGGMKAIKGKLGTATLYRFVPAKGKKASPSAFLAMADKTAFLSTDQAALAFLENGKSMDRAADLTAPDGDVVLTALVDMVALAKASGDSDLESFATAWCPAIHGSFIVTGREAHIRAVARNGIMMSMVGTEVEKTSGKEDSRRRAIGYLGNDAVGFLQINLPVTALTRMAHDAAPGLAEDARALVEAIPSIAGDVTFLYEEGLSGLTVVVSLNDVTTFEKGLDTLLKMSPGTTMIEDKVTIAGRTVRRIQFGEAGSPYRFTLFAAVKDNAWLVAMTRARMEALLSRAPSQYLANTQAQPVLDAVKAGVSMISHAYAVDWLGSAMPYVAVLSEGLSRSVSAYMDLFYLPALVTDLSFDSDIRLRITASETVLDSTTRFLGADPASKNDRESAFGKALMAKYAGSGATFRALLFDIAQKDATDLYGRHARRALVQSDPIADIVTIAGAVLMYSNLNLF